MRRRAFTQGLAAVMVVASGPLGCRRPRRRDDVLLALVREVVVPQTHALTRASVALAEACASVRDEHGLQRARKALATALIAWKRAYCFKCGPIVETSALLRSTYWPTRPSALEALVAASEPLSAQHIEALGVDHKGLYALEYLLFPLGAEVSATLSQLTVSERRRHLLEQLSHSVAQASRRVESELGSGDEFGARFAAAGQPSLSRLVNQMIGSLETLAGNRLDLVLSLSRNRLLRPRDVEGFNSGLSQQLVLAELEGAERLYRGGANGGLGDLVANASPAIDQRVRERLERALATLRSLTTPLETAVSTEPLAVARTLEAVKALEVSLKTEAASALGVTLTFQGTDGD